MIEMSHRTWFDQSLFMSTIRTERHFKFQTIIVPRTVSHMRGELVLAIKA